MTPYPPRDTTASPVLHACGHVVWTDDPFGDGDGPLLDPRPCRDCRHDARFATRCRECGCWLAPEEREIGGCAPCVAAAYDENDRHEEDY